jgi:hypothetical protein
MSLNNIIGIIPILPSANIERDVAWYKNKLGFTEHFSDTMYAVLYRENAIIHLQWHADTDDDPLLGGSVIRIYMKRLQPIFDELVANGTLREDKLRKNTSWNTNEFGLFDLNGNAIFFMEDVG